MHKCFHEIQLWLYFNYRIVTLVKHLHFLFAIFIMSWFFLASEQKEMPKPSQKQNMSCFLANCISKKSSLIEEGNYTGKAGLLIFFIEQAKAEWSQLKEEKTRIPDLWNFSPLPTSQDISPCLFKYDKPTHMQTYVHILYLCKNQTYTRLYVSKYLYDIHAKIWILYIYTQHLLIEDIFCSLISHSPMVILKFPLPA